MIKPMKLLLVLLMLVGTASGATVTMKELEVESDPVKAPIIVQNTHNLGCGELNISYDPSVVHVTGASKGDVGVVTYNFNNKAGWIYLNTFGTGISGNITFASLKLKPVSNGESELNISVISLFNTSYKEINYTVSDGEVMVTSLDNTGSSGGAGGGGGGGGSTFMLPTPTPSPTPTPTPVSNISMPSIPRTSTTNEEDNESGKVSQVTDTPTPTPEKVLSEPQLPGIQLTILGAIAAAGLVGASYVVMRRR